MCRPHSQRSLWMLLAATVLAFGVYAADDAAASDAGAQDAVELEQESPDPALAKIVVVAGNQSGNLAHQYWAGAVAIAKLLRQTPGVHVALVRGGWPKNEAIFDHARAIVLYMEGGEGGAIHPLTLPGRMDVLQKALDAGAGLATFHKAAALPPELGSRMMAWQGAYYDFKSSVKGHWPVAFNQFPEHPITRGMKPFALNDGYCIGLKFPPDTAGLTPILFAPKGNGKETLNAESTTKLSDLTAWAYERAGGGRAFGFTGLHSHRYLENESIRKLTINGILWAAKLEVPADGAPVAFDPADLERNLENVKGRKPAAK
jgi:hypothetical protein